MIGALTLAADDRTFLDDARRRYVEANAATLRWVLDRPAIDGVFLNTKVNSITLQDYRDDDGWRGPGYTYGWIQGRGLESLVTHADFFAREDPALAERLDRAARQLYGGLADLFERNDRHAYFTYDRSYRPVVRDAAGNPTPQAQAGNLFTYSDAFVVKGLIAAAARYGDARLAGYVDRLFDIIAAIEQDRFVADEQKPFDHTSSEKRSLDFGPWMILLGAAGLLRRLGIDDRGFGGRFIEHVLAVNWDGRKADGSGLIRDHPHHDTANPGHAIEFVGFAHETLLVTVEQSTLDELDRVLSTAFNTGFKGPGIVVSVDPKGGGALSPNQPWWSLPETVRAAALAFERRRSQPLLDIWRRADAAFFKHYWRDEAPLAYQTLTAEGPVDFVPATPDLDPGYHTGLSLLGAIEAIDRMAGRH